MSRDMKPRKTPPARKSGGGTLFGLFIGLVIGVIAVAGVVWYINKAPLPFTTTGQQPKLPPPVASKPDRASHTRSAAGRLGAGGAARQAGRPDRPKSRASISTRSCQAMPKRFPIPNPRTETGDASPPKVSVNPPKRSRSRTRRSPAEAVEAGGSQTGREQGRGRQGKPCGQAGESGKSEKTLKEPIYLQAGSFQSASEADNQKARLALTRRRGPDPAGDAAGQGVVPRSPRAVPQDGRRQSPACRPRQAGHRRQRGQERLTHSRRGRRHASNV
jgi:cell division protein FtsN